jgi:hypothetical protein
VVFFFPFFFGFLFVGFVVRDCHSNVAFVWCLGLFFFNVGYEKYISPLLLNCYKSLEPATANGALLTCLFVLHNFQIQGLSEAYH